MKRYWLSLKGKVGLKREEVSIDSDSRDSASMYLIENEMDVKINSSAWEES